MMKNKIDSSESQDKSKIRILNRISNHSIGLIGVIVSIFSLILTIVFYYNSQKEPSLSYLVSPVKTIVFEYGKASNIKVYYQGSEIASDITASQVLIWNAGEKAIREHNVLEKIIIRTDPKVSILEVKLLKKSREVIGFQLHNNLLKQGIAPVSWKILENNDGAIVQLIYEGSRDVKIHVSGVIEGQSKLVNLTTNNLPQFTQQLGRESIKVEKNLFVKLLFTIVALILLISSIVWFFIFFKSMKKTQYERLTPVIFGVSYFIFAILNFCYCYKKLEGACIAPMVLVYPIPGIEFFSRHPNRLI